MVSQDAIIVIRHPLCRANQRGAALFIVVMVITLLTAVGVFVAHSTTVVDTAVGYARQAAQTLALADYGARLVASELGEGRAVPVFQVMDQRTQKNCPSIPATVNQPCYAYQYEQLQQRVNANTSNAANLIESPTISAPGSLGPQLFDASSPSGIEGVLLVELLDPFDISNIQGQSAAKPSGRVVTLNSIAQVRATSAFSQTPGWCGSEQGSTSASLLSVRAQVLVPTL
jgi:hypothetical protein